MRTHKRFNYASSQLIAIIYTSEFAKIRKVFTKRIYLFDSVSMERLKSAVQSALTKRKLSIALKKEQMECQQVMVNHLFSNFCPTYTIIYFNAPMHNQIAKLNERSISACMIQRHGHHGVMVYNKEDGIIQLPLEELANPKFQLTYMHPEVCVHERKLLQFLYLPGTSAVCGCQ